MKLSRNFRMAVALGCVAACTHPSSENRDAVIALDQAYAKHWLSNDADAVMSLFAEDAVIIPHDGDQPRSGLADIRAFWFAAGSPPVKVRQFSHHVSGASATDGHGVVGGRFNLSFEYEHQTYTYDGNFLLVARREADEVWRITHLTWNDPPPAITTAP